MLAWEQRKLGEESDVRDGTHDSPKYFEKGYPLVTSKNLKSYGLDLSDVSFISNEDFELINNRSKVDIGDILFGMIGTIGNPVLVDRNDFAIKNVALIKEKKSTSNHFLIQLLKSPIFDRYIANENAGGTQKFLALTKIRSFEFACPNCKEQTKIGNFFKQLDESIALQECELELLKLIKKGFLQQLFTVKDEKYPNLRFANFLEKWEQRKLGEFYYFKNGLNKEKGFFGKGTPIINFTDVFHNRGLFSSMLNGKVTLSNSEIERYKVEKGDLFFTRTSETIEEIGMNSVMLEDVKETVFSGFVLRGRAIEKEPLNNLFKKYVFSTHIFRNEMIKKSSMTTRALTSGTALKEMFFSYPADKDEQEKIGSLLTMLENKINFHEQQVKKLKKIKKSFLQKMFI
ncbi:restriction endonuclease subunit S [Vagococcus fluvialis]|uniref:restriction endonuclease subunit S n=1 Tax=Vagococcus fluvialis TaxID=2738 RepID=UPI003B225025